MISHEALRQLTIMMTSSNGNIFRVTGPNIDLKVKIHQEDGLKERNNPYELFLMFSPISISSFKQIHAFQGESQVIEWVKLWFPLYIVTKWKSAIAFISTWGWIYTKKTVLKRVILAIFLTIPRPSFKTIHAFLGEIRMQEWLKTVISCYIPYNMKRRDTTNIDGLKEGVSLPPNYIIFLAISRPSFKAIHVLWGEVGM